MTAYDAIMKAARHIERHPKQFNFAAGGIPDGPRGCGRVGCALGWIGYFMGLKDSYMEAAHALLPNYEDSKIGADGEFYDRLEAFEANWPASAKLCARALRKYAKTYHAREKLDPAYVKLRWELKKRVISEKELVS